MVGRLHAQQLELFIRAKNPEKNKNNQNVHGDCNVI